MFVMAAGAAMLVSALQVYFRDVKNFLPYFLRIWLYASPVLYYASEVPDGIQLDPRRQPAGRPADRVERRDHRRRTRPSCERARSGRRLGVRDLRRRRRLFFISREREFAVRL